MSSTLKWIRRNYNVPAFQGLEITYRGNPAVIIGGIGGHLRLRVPGRKRAITTHPRYATAYPQLPLPARPRGWCEACTEERALNQDGTVGRHQRNGAERFPIAERLCPGAHNKPWAVCSWTIPAPTTTTVIEEDRAA